MKEYGKRYFQKNKKNMEREHKRRLATILQLHARMRGQIEERERVGWLGQKIKH